MNLTIYLTNQMQFNVTVDNYDATDFAIKMNNPQLTVISLGDVVLNKHAVMMIVPTEVVPTA